MLWHLKFFWGILQFQELGKFVKFKIKNSLHQALTGYLIIRNAPEK